MNYVIAVLADRMQAEAAVAALEEAGFPKVQIGILGKGYQTAAEFGLIDPKQPAREQAKLMSFWLVPFGFVGGVAFNLSTQYQLLPQFGILGNQILGGLLGAIAGAMGSFFIGGGIGLFGSDGDALPFRNRLKEGKYLVVVKGASNLTNKATKVLREFEPESIQGYIDPNPL